MAEWQNACYSTIEGESWHTLLHSLVIEKVRKPLSVRDINWEVLMISVFNPHIVCCYLFEHSESNCFAFKHLIRVLNEQH